MQEQDPLKSAKDGVSLVVEVLRAAGDDPRVKEAAGNLGQTAVTLTKTINNVLVPLAAINFAFDKARAYFCERFQQDLAAKAAAIPPQHLVEPKASVAGPTLQGLAFAHEEPDLKQMYINLLTTAMDSRVAPLAHPAFVEIIRQLDSGDARYVRPALQSSNPIPIVQIHRKLKGSIGYHLLMQHLLNVTNNRTGAAAEIPEMPAMVDNWVRLGLVEVAYDKHLTAPDSYSWVEQRPEFVRLRGDVAALDGTVQMKKGLMQRTELGKRFAQAIGLA